MTQYSQLQVDNIVDLYGTGAPQLPYSAVIPPSGTLNVNGNLHLVGVSTLGSIDATSVQSTTITALSFIGDGSQLTGLPIVNDSKVIGLSLVL